MDHKGSGQGDKGSLQESRGLLDRLQALFLTTKPEIRAWLVAEIEVILAKVPFLEASMIVPFPAPKEPRLLTPQQASELLNIPVRWLYRHTRRLPHRKFGRYTRFPERELLKWVEKQQYRSL